MSRHRRGFTLIELLVVVAITALLISILLPAMARAREQAKMTHCATRVRQLGIGMMMYLHEYDCYPGHQWRVGDENDTRIRWFNAMANLLAGYAVQSCPSVPDWEVGRNNSYGYNYKYIGSVRDNEISPTAPYETFPVKELRAPGDTIAFADCDGTGWTKPHVNGVKDVDMFGNHGYTLDPTYIPDYSVETYSGGDLEPYAWHDCRTYISDRHMGGSNACFADGHVTKVMPKDVYQDNRFWNGLGFEDPELDPHVSYRYQAGEFRYELE
jgi:prepilin-type N-terminal cleavage/methylation domain-containing protein/prepilin-type processing-associated H-X9-DG protein